MSALPGNTWPGLAAGSQSAHRQSAKPGTKSRPEERTEPLWRIGNALAFSNDARHRVVHDLGAKSGATESTWAKVQWSEVDEKMR